MTDWQSVITYSISAINFFVVIFFIIGIPITAILALITIPFSQKMREEFFETKNPVARFFQDFTSWMYFSHVNRWLVV